MKWTHNPTILGYIVDCYAGVGEVPGSTKKRREFLWQEGTDVLMGNTDAFLEHLIRKFELTQTATATTQIHDLLRQLGERVLSPRSGPTVMTGRQAGKFRQPAPESWVVGHAPTDMP